MLSSPKDGWTDFQPDSSKKPYCLSYLTDVAVEWLNQAIYGLETMLPFAVHGVCEPGRMVCTVSYYNCYVVFEGENRHDTFRNMYDVHMNMLEFCKDLHADISGSLEAWVHWDDGGVLNSLEDERNEEEVRKAFDRRRKELQGLLDSLQKMIRKREKAFAPSRSFF